MTDRKLVIFLLEPALARAISDATQYYSEKGLSTRRSSSDLLDSLPLWHLGFGIIVSEKLAAQAIPSDWSSWWSIDQHNFYRSFSKYGSWALHCTET